ncbi:hypothetical protein ACVB8X_00140 [Streptomyces sp. NRAIS4]
MTPWLHITLPCRQLCLRLLLLVLAAALPAYGTVTGYAAPAYATERGPGGSSARGHPHVPAPTANPNRPGPGDADHPKQAADPAPSDQATHSEQTAADQPDGPDSGPPAFAGHDHSGPDGSPVTGPVAGPVPIPPFPPLPSDSASASYRPATDVEPTRAGSRAGEGRMRPGRPDGPAAEVEGDDDPVPIRTPGTGRPEDPETADLPAAITTAPDAPDQAGLDQPPARNASQQDQATTEPVLQILPLGSGLVLIGLGLALAFLGLKLRRG